MSEEISYVMSAINQIYDNLWIGDIKIAFEVATQALQQGKIEKLVEAAEMAKKLITFLRIEAKEKEIEDKEDWVTESFLKRLEDISIDDAIAGVMMVHLSNLKAALNYLVESGKIKPLLEEEEPSQLRKEKRYKCVVISQPPKFEVKALLDTSFSVPNFERLKKVAEELGLNPTILEKSKAAMTLRFFSGNEFVEVIAQRFIARIIMTMREPSEERMNRISSKILEMLTEEKNGSFDRK